LKKTYRIFISATEVSADEHGANLVRHLKKYYPRKFTFYAVGGEHLKKAGVRIYKDISTRSTVGFTEGLGQVKSGFTILGELKMYLQQKKIDLLLCIDGQGRNLPLGKAAAAMGLKTVYYFPPPVFIWGSWNIKKLKNYDLLLCPFKANARIYRQAGINTLYTGHPFAFLRSASRAASKKKLGLKPRPRLVALFPGSRVQEIKKLLPVFLQTAALLREQCKQELQFAIAISHKGYKKVIKKISAGRNIPLIYGRSDRLLQAADFLITASGTVTLKAAMFNTPMAVCYKVSWFTYFIGRLLVKVPWIGIVNILAGKTVCREFINRDCRPSRIAAYTQRVISSKAEKKTVQKMFAQIRKKIKAPDPARKTAAAVYNVCKK